jgi:hypothetical protein
LSAALILIGAFSQTVDRSVRGVVPWLRKSRRPDRLQLAMRVMLPGGNGWDAGTDQHRTTANAMAACRLDGELRGLLVPVRAEVLTETVELEGVQKLLLARYRSPTAW